MVEAESEEYWTLREVNYAKQINESNLFRVYDGQLLVLSSWNFETILEETELERFHDP